MKHNPSCDKAFEQHAHDVAEYFVAWPHHCKHCGGWGGAYGYYDPSPSGVSLGSGSMLDFDPCPHCVEEGICPRCGRELLDSDGFDVCEHCGFDFYYPEGEPPEPECFCNYADADSIFNEV